MAQLLLGRPLWSEITSKGVLRCMRIALGNPSPEDVSIMGTYPAWQPHFADPRKATWDQVTCKNESTEVAWDLAWKLLQWSPARPPEFKHKAIPAKAIHIIYVVCFACPTKESDPPVPSWNLVLECGRDATGCFQMFHRFLHRCQPLEQVAMSVNASDSLRTWPCCIMGCSCQAIWTIPPRLLRVF